MSRSLPDPQEHITVHAVGGDEQSQVQVYGPREREKRAKKVGGQAEREADRQAGFVSKAHDELAQTKKRREAAATSRPVRCSADWRPAPPHSAFPSTPGLPSHDVTQLLFSLSLRFSFFVLVTEFVFALSACLMYLYHLYSWYALQLYMCLVGRLYLKW